jgi:hypothetical protein
MNPKVHNRVHSSPLVDPIPRQLNPITPQFRRVVLFHVILQSASGFPHVGLLTSRSQPETLCAFLISMSRSIHSIWLRLRTGRKSGCSSTPGRDTAFRPTLGPSQSVVHSGRESDRVPSGAVVKNAWSCISVGPPPPRPSVVHDAQLP